MSTYGILVVPFDQETQRLASEGVGHLLNWHGAGLQKPVRDAMRSLNKLLKEEDVASLLEQEYRRFRIGDRVRVIASLFENGTEGRITELNPNNGDDLRIAVEYTPLRRLVGANVTYKENDVTLIARGDDDVAVSEPPLDAIRPGDSFPNVAYVRRALGSEVVR